LVWLIGDSFLVKSCLSARLAVHSANLKNSKIQ
jgi:hypothetical protein